MQVNQWAKFKFLKIGHWLEALGASSIFLCFSSLFVKVGNFWPRLLWPRPGNWVCFGASNVYSMPLDALNQRRTQFSNFRDCFLFSFSRFSEILAGQLDKQQRSKKRLGEALIREVWPPLQGWDVSSHVSVRTKRTNTIWICIWFGNTKFAIFS